MKRAITIERSVPHSLDCVWRALTDREQLARWFMDNDLEAELGHAFTFRMKPQRGWDGVTHCQAIELEAQRCIAFTYRGQASGEKPLACAGIEADTVRRVRLQLTAAPPAEIMTSRSSRGPGRPK
jgi:uncharacterized protein YndB with AHSA1/START domain